MLFIRYNDLWLRIISSVLAAHFIVVYGVEKTLFQILLTPIYYVAMAASIAIAFTLISFVRWVSLHLSKNFDWMQKPMQRTGLQVLLGWIVPGILAFLMAFVYFYVREMDILDTLYLRFDYPIILLLILLLNLYYLAYYFYERMQFAERSVSHSPIGQEEVNGELQQTFLVNQGARSIPILLTDIAYFFREGDYNFLRTINSSDYVLVQSLDEVQTALPIADFFRANRQVLVSRKSCHYFEPMPYNKLELFVEPGYKGQIVISQKKKPLI